MNYVGRLWEDESFTLPDALFAFADRLDAALKREAALGNALAQERAKPGGTYDKAAYEQVCAELERMRLAMKGNVGDAYNLLTQGESPTQRRQPSAQRIYDRSKAALRGSSDVALPAGGEGSGMATDAAPVDQASRPLASTPPPESASGSGGRCTAQVEGERCRLDQGHQGRHDYEWTMER
jgi:hypothetical protein